ncbi:MAG TPA: ABC transporter ATP-binding protein [Ktedonobacteraceae bacterium]|nr:ABC transporter ATP-binding protein [Ktedonobacteraceae bacterium]
MIEAQSLTRRFGTVTAVSDVSLSVPDGSILALLGPNGAGKTTTVRMLSGLLAPTEGTALVSGYDVRRDPAAVRSAVGLVTDVPGLFEQMTLPDYLDFFGSVYGMPVSDRVRRADELIDFFELGAHRKEKMAGFSKGMKQKVALARALIHEPAVLYLDEPTSGLDPLSARSVRELILTLKHARRSIILCTHDLDEAERLADKVALIRQGHIVACDTPDALRARASDNTLVRIELADPFPLTLGELQGIEGLIEPKLDALPPSTPDGKSTPFLEYRTAQPRNVNPRVLTLLSQAGAQIVSVTSEHSTLEDVYTSAMNGGSDQ